MAQKVHDLVFVSAGTPVLDLTWSPSEGVMMMMMISYVCDRPNIFKLHRVIYSAADSARCTCGIQEHTVSA